MPTAERVRAVPSAQPAPVIRRAEVEPRERRPMADPEMRAHPVKLKPRRPAVRMSIPVNPPMRSKLRPVVAVRLAAVVARAQVEAAECQRNRVVAADFP